jgi:4-amino-4-deoxy-L-arabinose transferase-like glycosyltransferase
MGQQVRYQFWIVAAAVVICFTNLGGPALWDMDEALYASCAREMFQRGDWVVPWFNGQMFPEKPVLMFWTMMAGFELFGVNELGARFFSAVLGVATALCAFHWGRIVANARVGLWTGLITASTLIFTVSARAATVDSALTFVTTAAFLLLAMARRGRPARASWPLLAPMYACLGLAVLAKGPVGMVLPLAAMACYLLWTDGWRKAIRSAWWMRPCTGLLIMAAVALPWYVGVGMRTDGSWLRQFFLEFNLRPFRQPILSHGDTSALGVDRLAEMALSILYYFYHVPFILVGFFPWAVFLGPALVETVGQLRRRDACYDGCVLATCWFGTWFLFWSICKTKLPHYLLPAYPALALLTALFIDRWQEMGLGVTGGLSSSAENATKRVASPFPFLPSAWLSLILVGIGILIVVPIVSVLYLPGEAVLGLLGLIPAIGGGWCWWKTSHGQPGRAIVAFAVTAVVFLTAIFGFASLRVDHHQNARPMMAAIRADYESSKEGKATTGRYRRPARLSSAPRAKAAAPPIATYGFFRESTVFYAGHPVTTCDDHPRANRSARQELQEFLAKSNRSYVITTNEYTAEIDKDFPGRFQVIFRQPCFLRPMEMVVLRTERNEGESGAPGSR